LGVLLGVPTIGVMKKWFNVDGLNEASVRKLLTGDLQRRGEALEIIGRSGVLGAVRFIFSPKNSMESTSI